MACIDDEISKLFPIHGKKFHRNQFRIFADDETSFLFDSNGFLRVPEDISDVEYGLNFEAVFFMDHDLFMEILPGLLASALRTRNQGYLLYDAIAGIVNSKGNEDHVFLATLSAEQIEFLVRHFRIN
ncbi:MAG: hypothetical protein AAGL17_24235 [Cyanobacteria bacterium J06576_12]